MNQKMSNATDLATCFVEISNPQDIIGGDDASDAAWGLLVGTAFGAGFLGSGGLLAVAFAIGTVLVVY